MKDNQYKISLFKKEKLFKNSISKLTLIFIYISTKKKKELS